MLDDLKSNAADWDANSPPGLEFLFEARVKLHLPAMDVGPVPGGNRVIFLVKGGAFEGPHLRGRVVPDSGADWIRIRPDGTGVLDVRFCLETHDNALLYLHWQGRFWSAPDDAVYALDLEKPDDPAGAWRYYFRAAPQFETGDSRYAWLNNIIAVTKSRTGDGGPIHRVVITHVCEGRDQVPTVFRMVPKTLAPVRRAVSMTVRTAASPSAAHIAR